MRTFMPYADEKTCKVTRTGSDDEALELSPAEVDKLAKLIGQALGMESLEVLPDRIAHSPFVIRFMEEGFLRVERTDTHGSLRLTWEEGDSLITTLHDAKNIAINERTLIKGPRGASTPSYSETPYT